MSKKSGLVLEGGAMRGLFSAGVTDVFLENDITFDGMVGVSAGAAFGCNFKSRQHGRALRYNLKYCRDSRYCSIRSLIKTGDLFGVDFCYRKLPFELDPFDVDTFRKNPMEFYVVCTDLTTGKAAYYKCDDGAERDLEVFRASASMPLVSRIVYKDGTPLLDGGIADSVPLKFFEDKGYEKNVVVLTRPADYIKGENKALPLIKRALREYPAATEAMRVRHEVYNESVKYAESAEKDGRVFIIRPPQKLPVGRLCKDPKKLHKVYNIGRETALSCLDELKEFLKW
ncbi:MAG: patatin family protein [Clostridia bacterium]|nr:patatin family protein [Clostridia bacterium]